MEKVIKKLTKQLKARKRTGKDTVDDHWLDAQAEECLMWKRKAKKGWGVLGVSDDQVTLIKNLLKS